jgi:hypothetical protein
LLGKTCAGTSTHLHLLKRCSPRTPWLRDDKPCAPPWRLQPGKYMFISGQGTDCSAGKMAMLVSIRNC